MPAIDPHHSALAIIDIQQKLMPAIANGKKVLDNTQRLLEAARLLDIPRVFTEQNPQGLGTTEPRLAPGDNEPVLAKMTFNACRNHSARSLMAGREQLVVAGCEAHVCVLQTVLGLLGSGCQVYVVSDAVGSRSPDNRLAALQRMADNGAEIVSAEMVLFEWLGDTGHPNFRDILALIK